MKKPLLILTLLAAPLASQATGIYQCEPVAEEAWLSEEEVQSILSEQGWEVSRMKKDGGCWEVYGNSPDGDRVEAYVAPDTAEVLLIAQRGNIIFQK